MVVATPIQCPRCNGSMLAESDAHGSYSTCLACGYVHESRVISVFELNISIKQFSSGIGISEINCSGLFIGSTLIIFFITGVEVGTVGGVAIGEGDAVKVGIAVGISIVGEIGNLVSEFLHEVINTIKNISNIFIKYLKYKINALDLFRTNVL